MLPTTQLDDNLVKETVKGNKVIKPRLGGVAETSFQVSNELLAVRLMAWPHLDPEPAVQSVSFDHYFNVKYQSMKYSLVVYVSHQVSHSKRYVEIHTATWF